MHKPESTQPRNFTKRHYSTVISTGQPIIQQQSATGEHPLTKTNTNSKPQFRRTDHTDDRASQITNSHINNNDKNNINIKNNHNHNHKQEVVDQQQQYGYSFNVSHINNNNNNNNGVKYQIGTQSRQNSVHTNNNNNSRHYSSSNKNNNNNITSLYDLIIQKQRNIVQLRERLKNIHHFYRVRIEEQRDKNITRSQIFVGIIDELQDIHSQKIMALQDTYQQNIANQNQASLADQRVSKMKKNIQQIIQQSQKLKNHNELLEQQIIQKRAENNKKQQKLMNSKQEVDEMRDKLEQFERARLKQNRKSKELLQMMTHIFQ